MSIRKTRRSTLIAAGVGALAVSALFAGHLAAHQAGTGPGGWAPRMYRRAVRQLGLSQAQQTQIRGILRAHADEIQAQLTAGLESRRALRAAKETQPADEAAIRRFALELGEVKAEGAVLRARIRSEIWPILTGQQQEKARNLRSTAGRRARHRLEALDRWLRSDG